MRRVRLLAALWALLVAAPVAAQNIGAGTQDGVIEVGGYLSPAGVAPGDVDLNGNDLIVDVDGDTFLQSSGDDVIDFFAGGFNHFRVGSLTNTFLRNTMVQDGISFVWGAGDAGDTFWRASEATPDLVLALGPDQGRFLLLADTMALGDDYLHGVQTHPTLFVHSATRAATATDEWLSLVHDTSHALVATGSGDIRLSPFSNELEVEDAIRMPDASAPTCEAGHGCVWVEDDQLQFRNDTSGNAFLSPEYGEVSASGAPLGVTVTISAANTFVELQPTTALKTESSTCFSQSANGRLQYTCAPTRVFKCTAHAAINNPTIQVTTRLRLADNGTTIATSEHNGDVFAWRAEMSTQSLIELAQNEYVSVFLANGTNTNNLTLDTLNLICGTP